MTVIGREVLTNGVMIKMECMMTLCRESKDVLRRGVDFAASVVHRQFYTGCVDNETTSFVDAGSDSSTDFERRKHS